VSREFDSREFARESRAQTARQSSGREVARSRLCNRGCPAFFGGGGSSELHGRRLAASHDARRAPTSRERRNQGGLARCLDRTKMLPLSVGDRPILARALRVLMPRDYSETRSGSIAGRVGKSAGRDANGFSRTRRKELARRFAEPHRPLWRSHPGNNRLAGRNHAGPGACGFLRRRRSRSRSRPVQARTGSRGRAPAGRRGSDRDPFAGRAFLNYTAEMANSANLVRSRRGFGAVRSSWSRRPSKIRAAPRRSPTPPSTRLRRCCGAAQSPERWRWRPTSFERWMRCGPRTWASSERLCQGRRPADVG
jgi:hypothetical protein